jgi:hypothetical protein
MRIQTDEPDFVRVVHGRVEPGFAAMRAARIVGPVGLYRSGPATIQLLFTLYTPTHKKLL